MRDAADSISSGRATARPVCDVWDAGSSPSRPFQAGGAPAGWHSPPESGLMGRRHVWTGSAPDEGVPAWTERAACPGTARYRVARLMSRQPCARARRTPSGYSSKFRARRRRGHHFCVRGASSARLIARSGDEPSLQPGWTSREPGPWLAHGLGNLSACSRGSLSLSPGATQCTLRIWDIPGMHQTGA
jgi:hypothetical protein